MNERVVLDILLDAAIRYERSADSMGQTFSNWPEYQREKALKCREAADYLVSTLYAGKWCKDI